MSLSLVVVIFLIFAVLLSVGILLAVALPQMKPPHQDGDDVRSVERKHTSRTGR